MPSRARDTRASGTPIAADSLRWLELQARRQRRMKRPLSRTGPPSGVGAVIFCVSVIPTNLPSLREVVQACCASGVRVGKVTGMRSPVLAAVALTLACLAGCGGGSDPLDVLDAPAGASPAVTVPPDPPSTPTGDVDRVWVCATVPDGDKRPSVYSDTACPTDHGD